MADINEINNQSSERDEADLQSDLQVPVQKPNSTSPAKKVDDDFVMPPSSSSPSRTGQRWPWIIAGAFIIVLIGATIYFFLSRMSFNQGTIRLTFEPTDVDVVIDGKFNKRSVESLVVKLKAGDHLLQVTKEGYLDFERDFGLKAGEDADMHVTLEPIPNAELLAEGPTAFIGLARSGKTVVYLNSEKNFVAVDNSIPPQRDKISLFSGAFDGIRDVTWSPGEPTAVVKIQGFPKLENMYDNRGVRGRFVPLGERPVQGLARNAGVSTWLFSDARHTAQGWQPVLLNESIRSVAFAPDGSRIIYFYETADGEKSLVAAHPDGGEWERLLTDVEAIDPTLYWLNEDRYVLLLDDRGRVDRLFDTITKSLSEIMSDRASGTAISGSPDGTRILYLANVDNAQKLAVWNIASGSQERVFDKSVVAFVWQTDNRVIVSQAADNTLWYWDLDGEERPVQFVSSFGALSPSKLLYSLLSKNLFVIEADRILGLQT